MTERELQTALERLAPHEPAQTHEDFLRAVWSAEGETKRMKKQLQLVPILVAIIVVILATLFLNKTATKLYIESVGINPRASRLFGLNSTKIIFIITFFRNDY